MKTKNFKHILEKATTETIRRGMDPNGIHGQQHWQMVGTTASILLAANGHNPELGDYFGILHDCCRYNDGYDSDHGLRAARFTDRLRKNLPFTKAETNSLIHAIEIHNTGETPREGNIQGCCLDGDRLDLGRVGMDIDIDYLSTEQAHALINNTKTQITTSAGVIACLWHGSSKIERTTTRLQSFYGVPIYLSESQEVAQQYGTPYRVLLSTPTMMDLTDIMALIKTPAFSHLKKLSREYTRQGLQFRQSGEPFCLFTALESGGLYEEDPTRQLTEEIARTISQNTKTQVLKLFDDNISHRVGNESVATWLTWAANTTMLW